MKRNKGFIVFIFLLFTNISLFAQSQGETLFKENKPKEAVKVLENEILNGIVSANTYNFLGLGYYQIGEYAKSIDAFNRGIKEQPSIAKLLSFNQGNTYYAMKDYTSAVRCYTDVIKEDDKYYEAYLNRANALLMANNLTTSREEYIGYLEKCPEDKQRPKIEELIKALEKEIARREEEERLLAEQEKARWEQYDASFEEMVDEDMLTPWERVDASIAEEKKPETDEKEPEQEVKASWESVEARIPAEEKESVPEVKTDWESVEAKIPSEEKEPEQKLDWEKVDIKIAEEKKEDPKTDWEKVLFEKELAQSYKMNDELVVDDSEFEQWQELSLEDEDEMRLLDQLSKEEREKWLAEQERLIKKSEAEKKRLENEEKLRAQMQKEKEEQELRDRVMTEMMRAENERKQKLLDDLANSLMNSESTNMSSGADDIMDYDLEGELD